MKEVLIKKLKVHDFRGQNFECDLTNVNHVSGRNRSGKTTLFNAWLWLITGYDDENRSNFNLFDTTREYTHDDNPAAVVEATLLIDGIEYTITRSAKQSFTRPRGQEEYVKGTSDEYTFDIDGIKRSATEFKKWIEDNFAPIEMLKCALNTRHFLYNMPDWKSQRQLLSVIAGEISNDEFEGDYEELFSQFSKYTPDQLRDRLKTLLNPLKKALGTESIKGEKIVELETLQKAVVDIKTIEEAEKELVAQKERKAELQEMIKGKLSPLDDAREAQRKAYAEISKKESEIYELRRAYLQFNSADSVKYTRELEDIKAHNAAIIKANERAKKEFERKQQQIKVNEDNISAWNKRLEELREENIDIKSREFTDNTCAYCGAPLPEDKLAEQKAKFEERKEKDRLDNVTLGRQLKARIETAQSDLDILKKEIAEGLKQETLTDTSELEEKIQMANASYPPFEQTEGYKNFMAEIEKMKSEVPEIPTIDTSDLDAQIKAVEDKISELMLQTSMRPHYERQIAQINELKANIKAMAQERAMHEKIDAQLSAYEQEKADIVGRRVNKFFDKCRVSMFSPKKDGTLTPNCIITMDGRRSATLNKEATITAGIDVSNAFCKFYNLNLPLFIDDYESLSKDNHVVNTDRQLITLSVSDSDIQIVTE